MSRHFIDTKLIADLAQKKVTIINSNDLVHIDVNKVINMMIKHIENIYKDHLEYNFFPCEPIKAFSIFSEYLHKYNCEDTITKYSSNIILDVLKKMKNNSKNMNNFLFFLEESIYQSNNLDKEYLTYQNMTDVNFILEEMQYEITIIYFDKIMIDFIDSEKTKFE